MKHLLWTDTFLDTDHGHESGSKPEERLWEKAVYPIGNGWLGCTLFGDPRRERIQFNQESLWVGNEDSTGGYQPFGDVLVETGHGPVSDYRRELDLDRAVQTISYRSDGIRYQRTAFASHPARVLVFRFSADHPGALNGTISLTNIHQIPVTAEDDATLVMQGDTGKVWFWQKQLAEPERLMAGRETTSPVNIDLQVEARLRVLHQGGSVTRCDAGLRFEQCTTLTLLLAADTDYRPDRAAGWRGEHPHDAVCARIAAAADRSCDALLDEHVADYRSLFGRVGLHLGDSSAAARRLATPERLETYAAAQKAASAPADPELETLLYQYARYLMISSSRGGLPANLQGLWLIAKHPSWRCDYHTDVNLQMNYWFTAVSNLCDCFLPLAYWIDSIREVRKEETRKVLGVPRGWLMRSENGIFGGSTWHFQKGDSAWLCQNLWDHYTFTCDRDYLARWAYPVMKEIAEFWIDHLKELPDGTLVAPEGRSPEHGPVGVDGVTYDQQLCAELFDNTIAATDVLGVDREFRQQLTEKRRNLRSPQIGRWGQFQEWLEDIDDPEDDHRHINHLVGVYPGTQVHPQTTPELAEAARVSVTARRDCGQGHPGWSRVWKAAIFARLLDGDSAYDQLREMMAGHLFGNLLAVHPPFQIDANFGFAAGVNEMLVQSRFVPGCAPTVQLLPALPAAWPTGSATGLRARGRIELDLAWTDGALERAALRNTGPEDTACMVRYGDAEVTVRIPSGGSVAVDAAAF